MERTPPPRRVRLPTTASRVCIAALLLVGVLDPVETRGQTLTADLSIGGSEGEVALVAIDDIVVRDGRVYLLQRRVREIEHFGEDGTHLGAIGREGDGPGEFQLPWRFGWRADSLWVFDRTHGRVSLFGADGDFLDSFTSVYDHEEFPFTPTGPVALLPERGMLIRPEFPDNAVHRAPDTVPLLVTETGGTAPRAIYRLSVRSSVARVPVSQGGRAMYMIIPEPFSDDPLWSVSPSGELLAVVHRKADGVQDALRVVLLRPASGDTIADVRHPVSAAHLTRERIDAYIERRLAGLPGSLSERDRAEAARSLREHIYKPHFLPLAEAAFIDAVERVWISLPASSPGPTPWLVLDAEGQRIGRVEIPEAVQLLAASTRFAWGVTTDALDVPVILRFELPGTLTVRDAGTRELAPRGS